MEFPKSFICATLEYATTENEVPAPYLRKSFSLNAPVQKAELLICGLGFYELYLNGQEITKGPLAPYINNPDDLLYYDRYDIAPYIQKGENVIGVILGNGMQNSLGGMVWDFDKVPWRGAPAVALRADIQMSNGENLSIESNPSFRVAESPYIMNDLRHGVVYDANREICDWNLPGFDDSGWENARYAQMPRGEAILCTVEPIVATREISPVAIRKEDDGYLYDFGENTAGVCRLSVQGAKGQEIRCWFGEYLKDGAFTQKNIFCAKPEYLPQRQTYICRGGQTENFTPNFTYYGFRYVLVQGITEEQAIPSLLTYVVMNSALQERGGFSCSDEVFNRLQEMTRRSTLSNFYYFPTDCPHREKNGWTADAALSSEHALLNLSPENSYREWLRNIRKAQNDAGALPGIVPTGGWGFHWGNGPAWDSVLILLPYFIHVYRGDTEVLRENATSVFRYVHYLTTRLNAKGLVCIGLGDWCAPGCRAQPKAPLELTDSIYSMDICRKAAYLFDTIGMEPQRDFCQRIADELRKNIRRYLIDFSTMTAAGNCQTSQAMAIFYDVFEPGEMAAAFEVLLKKIKECNNHMDTGVLGARVIFHVLSAFGYTDLAADMIAAPTGPSYGCWVARGETALCEDLLDENGQVNSRNHHFFGDISSWFIQDLAGIQLNPYRDNLHEVRIAPHFASRLRWAKGYHQAPDGMIRSEWRREGAGLVLSVTVPQKMTGKIILESGWVFEDGGTSCDAVSGEYRIIKSGFYGAE